MTHIQRREFLELVGGGVALSFLPTARERLAQRGRDRGPTRRPALVCIYLRGGLDALNALVPYAEKRYHELRPTLAIPAADDPDLGPGVVRLDGTFGLHPALSPLKPLWDAGRLAAIVNSGSPHPTRSHFDAQDFMEYAAPGLRNVQQGWLNRYLELSRGRVTPRADGGFVLRALGMQGLLPRSLRGTFPVLAVPERRVLNNRSIQETYEDLYGPMDEGMGLDEVRDEVLEVGRETLETLAVYRRTVQRNRREDGPEYARGPYGQRLRDIAAILKADVDLEVACMDVPGWDHHANQGGNSGLFHEMAGGLAKSLWAFAQDLGEHFERTLVLIVTEFGRTVRENGTRGTDHGRGGLMFLLGASVRGGRVHGKWGGLGEREMVDGRDLPVTTDFRDVFADVLRQHLAFDPPKSFFPDYSPKSVAGLF